ncbi:MAG: hypothetical protein DWQ07_11555 [Chloroflexi bacterium]|nr:MAG: hypothetical protein DWQ07_11555 [Chloroflexota bacterium]MBL1197158.1 hypothetical protein [Chloroflexota bacterium]NOH14453.1 hypothetical protein [Chloroflexota bacterium]
MKIHKIVTVIGLLLVALFAVAPVAAQEEELRPLLSGEAKTYDTEHFRIHYTLTGDDAVSEDDADKNGIPDYVEQVGEAMERAWTVQVEQWQWAAPPTDGTKGGNALYDVYLQEEEGGAYADGGYDETIVGDNPATSAKETRSSYSYIGLDNNYTEDLDFVSQQDMLNVTSGHEFSHAIQFAYDGVEPLDWLWEATASWAEDEMYDDVNDGNLILESVFKSPDSCQTAYGGEDRVEDDGHWYGLWIFLRYLSESYGPETVRQVWETAAVKDGYAIFDEVLKEKGTTLEEFFQAYSVALLTRDFEEGADYPVLRLEGIAKSGQFTPLDGVGQLGADYVEIKSSGTVSVKLNSNDLSGVLVGIKSGKADVYEMDAHKASIDTARYDQVYLIAMNLQRPVGEEDCAITPYTVSVNTATTAQKPVSQETTTNFEAPQVEELLDPEDYWGDEDYGDLEGDFDEIDAPANLQPGYIPQGYEFAFAYEFDKNEFGTDEEAQWWVPGDGPATILDYYGEDDEDYLSVIANDSPHKTLDAFLSAVDYEAPSTDIQPLGGVKVLVEDWSDDEGVFSSATFIQGGQFIVIEGTVDVEEIAKVATSLIKIR